MWLYDTVDTQVMHGSNDTECYANHTEPSTRTKRKISPFTGSLWEKHGP